MRKTGLTTLLISIRTVLPRRNRFRAAVRLVVAALLLCTSPYTFADSLRAASDVWTPYFMAPNNTPSGIGFDIVMEIGRRSGDEISFRHFSNIRTTVMFERHEIDVVPLDSPLWNDPQTSEIMVFSDDIIAVQEYAYFLKEGYVEVVTPADLRGKSVSVIRGYHFPDFEEAFEKGIIKKQSIAREASLIKMLVKGRTDVIFMDSLAFSNNCIRLGYDRGMFKRGIKVTDTALGIKLRKEKAHILPRINRAIAAMKKDGTIDRIVKKYTLVK